MRPACSRGDYSLIRIEELEIFAHHGVYEEETINGQNFYVNADMYVDFTSAGLSDDLDSTVNYGTVANFIADWMKENTCLLIEAVAEKMSRALLLQFPAIKSLRLEIRKPEAPIKLPFESVSVEVKRGWHEAYLAFGSNMGDSKAIIEKALEELDARATTKLVKKSSVIVTKPYGGVEQDDFLNGVVLVKTLLSPRELLDFLHEIENHAGRTRELRWGPRTLDLDIIFYDKLIYEDEVLCIPHMDMANRDFVLKPMYELAPYFRHPISQKTITEMLQELKVDACCTRSPGNQ